MGTNVRHNRMYYSENITCVPRAICRCKSGQHTHTHAHVHKHLFAFGAASQESSSWSADDLASPCSGFHYPFLMPPILVPERAEDKNTAPNIDE